MLEWVSYPLYYAIDGQTAPRQAGVSHATIFPYGPFRTDDGKTVMLGLQNERESMSFCGPVIQQLQFHIDERFSSNSRRAKNREELAQLILAAFSTLTAAQVIERLEAACIANARIKRATRSPQEMYESSDSSGGDASALPAWREAIGRAGHGRYASAWRAL